MSQLVSCVCGERLELPPDQLLTEMDCPVCGRTVAVGPATSLDAPALRGNDAGPETALPTVSVVCPDCAGDGRCSICHRRTRSFWSMVMGFLDSGFDLFLSDMESARRRRYYYGPGYGDRSLAQDYIRSKVCVGCNGNRKCFKCRGTGTYTGP